MKLIRTVSPSLDKPDQKRSVLRKIKDFFAAGSTYLFSAFSLVALIAIVVFVVSKGYSTLSWDFIFGDYNSSLWSVSTDDNVSIEDRTYEYSPKENEYFASNWGLAFMDSVTTEGTPTVILSYIDPEAKTQNWINSNTNERFSPKVGEMISVVTLRKDRDSSGMKIISASKGAENMAENFSKYNYLVNMNVTLGGGGIRGSLISTLWMILFTMIFALPLGIGGAIYLGFYAKDHPLTRILRNAIDMISGIPSIIFGLVGGVVFLPITSGGGNSGNILTGALTLACMILPVIIKSTEESIKAIPSRQRDASLALGASQYQTVFKIILPNALPGILTSVLLGIGRVIGESAALVYTSGVAIMDYVIPTQGSATLAVHIWNLMGGESMNYEASCAVSILILIVVLILSILVKLISYRIQKAQKGK